VSSDGGFAAAIRALRYLEAAGAADPLLLLYHPPARNNPFQALLYLEALGRGVAPVPVARLEEAAAIVDLARGRARVALHLHWLAAITEQAAGPAAAAEQARAFLAGLDELIEAGCPVAWTIHNVLPHDARYPDEAVLLRRGVVDRAAMIHVLSPSTPAEVAPWFELPADRTALVPHPSYTGFYPDAVSRDAARFALGLWPDELVLLAFGALRPYKGIPELLAAWRATADGSGPRRLVVAGRPTAGPGTDEMLLELATTPGVLPVARQVAVESVAELFGAADVAVLAHRTGLNSGVLLLALTFGLPVVAPRMAATVDLLDERVARLYDAGDADGLAAALRDAGHLVGAGATARAREIAAAHEPREISRQFVEELRRRVAAAG
jgi:glycosyltransferase involved in cell wall biosynthesis